MTIPLLKADMRAAVTRRRDALEIDDRLEWDQELGERVLASGLLDGVAGPVAAYWPMRSEADPRPIMVALKERGVPLALPAMIRADAGRSAELVFRQWQPWEPIIPGGFGTLVPLEDAALVRPSALIIPLLAFDRRCMRLGYGKGYYDRAIAQLAAHGPVLTIGIAYAVQEVAVVPVEDHDARLDAIVTQSAVFQRKTAAA